MTDDKNFYTVVDRIVTSEQTLAMSTDPELTHEAVLFILNKMLLN
jgi:hypothetical protein